MVDAVRRGGGALGPADLPAYRVLECRWITPRWPATDVLRPGTT